MAIGSEYRLKYKITADTTGVKSELSKVDSLLGKIGSGAGLSSLAGPAAIGAAGVAAIGTAAVATAATLFRLTQQASDMGSVIYDATQKTGLSAEKISALKYAADQAGSSFEQVSKGVTMFGVQLGKASLGNGEAASNMKLLNVTSSDLDTALGQVFKTISEGKTDTEKLALASAAFGKKIGPDLIPLIKDANGNFEGLIKNAKDLGVTLSEEDVAAADRFGDAYDRVMTQATLAASKFALAYADDITEAFETVSAALAKNQDKWHRWGTEVGLAMKGVSKGVGELAQFTKDNPIVITWVMKPFLIAFDELKNYGAGGSPLREAPTYRKDVANDPRNPFYGKGGVRGTVGQKLGMFDPVSPDPDDLGSGKGTGGGQKKIKTNLPAFGSMRSLVISSGNAQWDAWFSQMGQKFGVDPNVLLLQAGKESSFKSSAVSPKGAKGFSQFMPGTAARFGVDTSSVKDSIRGQAQYMGQLLSEFGGDYKKALAGYNAGEGAVRRYGGIPPFKETRDYVGKISSQYASRVRSKDGAYGTFDPDEAAKDRTDAANRAADEEMSMLQEHFDDLRQAEKQASEDRLSIRRAESDVKAEIIERDVEAGILTEKEGFERLSKLKLDLLQKERNEIGGQISTTENIIKLRVLDLEIEKQGVKTARERSEIERKRLATLQGWNAAVRKRSDDQDKLDAAADATASRSARQSAEAGMVTSPGKFAGGIASGMGVDLVSQWETYEDAFGNTVERVRSQADQMKAIYADVADFAGGAIGGMVEGLGQMAIAWIVTGEGSAKSALQMMAATALSIAFQAGLKAFFEAAESAAAFARYDVVAGTAHATAATMYGMVASVAGAAGIGLAIGSRFVGGGGKGSDKSSESSVGSSSSNRKEDLMPSSRQDVNTFVSGRNSAIAALSNSVDRLEQKLGSMRPGDVVTAGVKARPGLVGTAAVNDMKRNANIGNSLRRATGGR